MKGWFIMNQLEIIPVSDGIIDQYLTDIIKYFTKNGFVNIFID